jgi:molybdopterin converting factor small subunit
MSERGTIVNVRVLVFASYADALGKAELSLSLPPGSTVGDCLAEVQRRAGERLPPAPLVAVNRVYARPEQSLSEGDEVALIPPVAGG